MSKNTELELAKTLVAHAVEAVLRNCGNSYVNSYTERWLELAKVLGVYKGPVVGSIKEVLGDWEVWSEDDDFPDLWKDLEPEESETKKSKPELSLVKGTDTTARINKGIALPSRLESTDGRVFEIHSWEPTVELGSSVVVVKIQVQVKMEE